MALTKSSHVPISGIVLAKNEENNLERTLNSLKFCAEVVLLNDDSSDKTVQIAKKNGARVYTRSINGNFAEQINFGISKAKYKYVLLIDADEVVSKELKNEIVILFGRGYMDEYNFKFKRIDFMWGKWLRYGEVGVYRDIRLMERKSGEWVRGVHQYFISKKKVLTLKNPILHFPHDTIAKFIEKIDLLSTLHAVENNKEKKKADIIKVVLWPIGHFVINYFLRFGFRDGMQGFVFALVMSFHSFFAWSKLYLFQRDQ